MFPISTPINYKIKFKDDKQNCNSLHAANESYVVVNELSAQLSKIDLTYAIYLCTIR